MNKYKNKKISVFGLGKSGLAVIKKLHEHGAKVFFSDSQPKHKISKKTLVLLKKLKNPGEFGGHTVKSVLDRELIVVSPGIHLDIPVLMAARKKNIPIISEIELAYSLLKKPIIAVTGTNGKTTTTTLIAYILNKAGFRAKALGNIGDPLIAVDDSKLDFLVVEVSSYQLETTVNFKPFISLLLNITPDHISWHKTMKNYALAKAKIFKNQDKNDYLIYNENSKGIKSLLKKCNAVKIPFNRKKLKLFKREDLLLKGEHNLENALAAADAAYLCGVKPEIIRKALQSFRGVEHRIEFVRELSGVSFYNDSKGTNPDSTVVAIKTFGKCKNIVLIAGGRSKDVSLKPMIALMNKHVKNAVLIGEAARKFADEFRRSGYKDYVFADSMRQAVEKSYALAGSGNIVLLSPACASFDMFKNFEERGKVFKQSVRELNAQKPRDSN